MSVSSFGSYEGHAPYEYGGDSGYPPVDQAEMPVPSLPWATEAGPGSAGQGGVPGGLAVSHVTDWRMAADEFGRPIPPPPGYAAQAAPDGPQPPTTLLPTAPFPPQGLPVGLFPVPAAWSPSGSPGYQAAQPPPVSMHAERAPFEVTTTAGVDAERLAPALPGDHRPEPVVAPYGSLPGVSLPSGAFVPASVPVSVAGIGVGLTALDDGGIGVDLPLPHPSREMDRPPGTDRPFVPDQPYGPGQRYEPDQYYGPDHRHGPDQRHGPDRSRAPELSYGLDPFHGPDQSSRPRPEAPSEPQRLGYGPSARSPQGPAPVAASDWEVVDGAELAAAGPPDERSPTLAEPAAVTSPPVLAGLAAAAAAVQAVAALGQPAAADGGDGLAAGTATGPVPLEPYRGRRQVSPQDLAARHAVVREQVDYALAEIALAKAAFRRACEDTGRPGWPFRDTEVDLMRRPAVAHALFCELAGVERLRVWAQELYWLQEQTRGFA
ncbi:hypothetical protein [Pseudofrankia sp. DC12]|uniref:hypothetical protein n=1 Tax=Pseudofrankia sp. DC12 TaxID=683315 RepID=UPI001E379A9A|nr:hypothetical protein [Pseudofrankia sp. DC12]